MEKRANGNKSDIWDDCGARGKASCPKGFFIERNGRFSSLTKLNGQYCTEKWLTKRESIFQYTRNLRNFVKYHADNELYTKTKTSVLHELKEKFIMIL